MSTKIPVVELLVERGLAPDLKRARALILAGAVVAGERRVDTAGERLPPDIALRLKGRAAQQYVGRGAEKLAFALDTFGFDPTGRVALDIGASTGGFTEVLLARGASRVYAVDVGHNQLAWSLRRDRRVVCLERTDARDLDGARVPEPAGALVADVSFTSLQRVLPAPVALLAPGAWVVVLAKPQFEVARSEVGAGGVVEDPRLHARVVEETRAALASLGLSVAGVCESPIRGARGNQEFLLGAVSPGRAPP